MSHTPKLSSFQILSCLVTLASASVSFADAKVERDDVVDANAIGGSVSFNHSVPLDAPDYYGIEPKLGIHYNVNSPVGLAGPGWDLTGFSTIERRGPTGGLPLFGTADRLFLDGQELISCAGKTSPGCAMGGTHVTKVENFARIVQTGATFVSCKDGICTTYQPIICTPSGTYRWGVAQVADLLGHTTTYAWENSNSCGTTPTLAYAYPSSVSYNKGRYVVSIRYDNSVNRFPQATGAGDIVRSRRIKNILITTLSKNQSAIGLFYTAGTDILSKIQPYGTDVTFDAANNISGGSTELPAQTYIAEANSVAFSPPVKQDVVSCPRGGNLAAMDINGDGYTDFVCVHARTQTGESVSGIEMFLNQKNGTFGAAVALGYPGDAKKEPLLIDVNCDQRPDIIWIANTCPAQWKARINQGNGNFSAEVGWGNLPTDVNVPVSAQFADLNGDGCTEYIYPSTTTSTQRLYRIMYGQPNKTSDTDVCLGATQPFIGLPSDAALDGWSVAQPFRFTDVDGNGAADLLYFKDGTTVSSAEVKVLFGKGYALGTSAISLGLMSDFYSLSTLSFGKLAGGRGSDMVYIKAGQTRVLVRPWNNANQQFAAAVDVAEVPTGIDVSSLSFGDFDGDGKVDILLLQNESATLVRPWTYRNISGDARLVEIRNGIGGVRKLVYANAATQPKSLNVPPQWVVKTSTEIIGSQTATTSYAYSGGLYDSDDKRFIGFAKITRTDPCVGTVCPQATVYYDLDYTGARPIRVDRRDVTNNKLLAATILRYTLTNTLPYKTQLSEKWEYAYSSTSTSVMRTATEFTYNSYGKVTAAVEYGDSTTAQRLRVTDYAPTLNTTYLVLPSRTALYVGGTQLPEKKVEESLYTYDTVGKLKKTEKYAFPLPEGTLTPYVATIYDYDATHRLTQTTDPKGRITKFGYEPDLELFINSTTNAANQIEKKDWNTLCAKPALETGPNGDTVTITYDQFCRPKLKSYAPGGNFERFTYVVGTATVRQNIKVETPSADGVGDQWTETYFDGAGRTFETRQKGPTTILVSRTFDLHGRLATETLPYVLGATTYPVTHKYDALGRPTEISYASGEKNTVAYGDRFICRTDEENHTACDDVDGLGRVVNKREIASGTRWVNTALSYNVRGDLISIRDALGNVTGIDYDSLGNVIAERDSARGNSTRTYNAASELVKEVNALGEITLLTYDSLGRISGRTTRSGTAGAQSSIFTYDLVEAGFGNIGHITKTTDSSGYTTYRYNVDGTLNRTLRHFNAQGDTPPADQILTYKYDAAGRLTETGYPDGTASRTAYDAAARPKSLTFVQGTTLKTLASATYDAAGRKAEILQENGYSTVFTYSPQRGFLTEKKATVTGETTPRIRLVYGRNKEGVIGTLTRTIAPAAAETITYGYDTRHQLLSAASTATGTQTWTYDDIGRVLTSPLGTYCYAATTTAYPAPQSVRAVGNCTTPTYQYNALGQLTSGRVAPTNSAMGSRTLVYNGRGQVERVTINRLAGEQPHVEEYAYDTNGLRVRSRVASASCAPQDAIMTYTFANDYEMTQIGSSDMLTQHFMLAGELIARRTKVEAGKRCATCTKTTQDTFVYLHTDHLGSILAESKPDKTLANLANYRAFGEELNQQVGPSSRVHRSYLGERRDATGLLYLNARYYDPTLAQFVSTDPLRHWDVSVDLNPYTYSLNNPVNRSDASGADSMGEADADVGAAATPHNKAAGDRPYDGVSKSIGDIDEQTKLDSLANSLRMIPTAAQQALQEPDVSPTDVVGGITTGAAVLSSLVTHVGRGLVHALRSHIATNLKWSKDLTRGKVSVVNALADATGRRPAEMARRMYKNDRWDPDKNARLEQVADELHDFRIALASPREGFRLDAINASSARTPLIVRTRVSDEATRKPTTLWFTIRGTAADGRPMIHDPDYVKHTGPMDFSVFNTIYQHYRPAELYQQIRY